MSWVFTFLIAVLSAGMGTLAAGYVAYLTVDWHSISSFEGKSGFFVVGMALVGAVGGFVVGAIASRVVGAQSLPQNAAGLGAGVAAVLVICGLFAAYSYLTADFPPTLGGRQLELEIEVRLPAGMEPGALPVEPSGPQVTLYSGQAYSGRGDLRLAEAREEGGRWVVPAKTFLGSSQGGRRLVIHPTPGGTGFYIPIPLAGRPTDADRAWSGWFGVEYRGDLGKPTESEQYEARYRVIVEEDAE